MRSKTRKRGTRLDKLKALAKVLAQEIDEAESKELASLARQYRETLKEIEEIEGGSDLNDEIGEILSGRDGMSDSVRKNRT